MCFIKKKEFKNFIKEIIAEFLFFSFFFFGKVEHIFPDYFI